MCVIILLGMELFLVIVYVKTEDQVDDIYTNGIPKEKLKKIGML